MTFPDSNTPLDTVGSGESVVCAESVHHRSMDHVPEPKPTATARTITQGVNAQSPRPQASTSMGVGGGCGPFIQTRKTKRTSQTTSIAQSSLSGKPNTTTPFFENKISQESVPEDEGSEWLNTVEAAEYLRTSPAALRNMTSNGAIPYHKLGRRNRYKRSDLRSLLLQNRRGGF